MWFSIVILLNIYECAFLFRAQQHLYSWALSPFYFIFYFFWWLGESQYKLTTVFYFGWTCTGMPDEQREGLQEELIDIILLVLKRNPQLHYYQGYHDIVVTFLLVLGERLATALVEKLSTHHLRYLIHT